MNEQADCRVDKYGRGGGNDKPDTSPHADGNCRMSLLMGRKLSSMSDFFFFFFWARSGLTHLAFSSSSNPLSQLNLRRESVMSRRVARKAPLALNSWILLNPLQFDPLLWLDVSEGNRSWDTSYQGLSIVYANMNQTQQESDSRLHTCALPPSLYMHTASLYWDFWELHLAAQ